MGELGPVTIFEYDDIMNEFIEFKTRLPLHESLDSDKILLFNDSSRSKMWIWHGSNTTTRMKFIAAKLAPIMRDKHGIGFRIQAIDEDNEPLGFKVIFLIVSYSNINCSYIFFA